MTTVKKHLTAIQSGKIERSNIIGIRKALNAHWRNVHGYGTGTTAPQWIDGDVRAILDACKRYHPTALGELHNQGARKLRDKRNARYLSDKAKRIVSDKHLRFDLIGWQDTARGQFQPVWCCIGWNESFDFISLSWQAIAYSRNDSLAPIVELSE